MSALALTPEHNEGLRRSAALMRALGARAASVWATLSPQEASRLTAAMDALPDDARHEHAAAEAYLGEMSRAQPEASDRSDVWQVLSTRDGAANADLLAQESPQVIAVILSRMTPGAAAATVRALPRTLATTALQRLMHLGEVHPGALRAIEETLQRTTITRQIDTASTGHERVARIFDSLDSRVEQGLLASLDSAEPGAGERIRALMFTFDDLAALGPASIQTILSSLDRALLIMALKGAKPATTEAIFRNMTARAADLLRSEIEATGPVRRSEVEAARSEIIALARTLVKRGDILSGDDEDDELVE